MTANQIAYQNYLELVRSNKAAEAEKYRNNLRLEAIRQQEADEAGRHNAAVEYETGRANAAREAELYRSNLAQEFETARSHKANETINWQQAITTAAHYVRLDDETQRHNEENERLQNQGNVFNYSVQAQAQQTSRENTAATNRQSAANATSNLIGDAFGAVGRTVSALISKSGNSSKKGSSHNGSGKKTAFGRY